MSNWPLIVKLAFVSSARITTVAGTVASAVSLLVSVTVTAGRGKPRSGRLTSPDVELPSAKLSKSVVIVSVGVSELIVVGSLAELFAGETSPPPETLAMFVTASGELLATETVTVTGS